MHRYAPGPGNRAVPPLLGAWLWLHAAGLGGGGHGSTGPRRRILTFPLQANNLFWKSVKKGGTEILKHAQNSKTIAKLNPKLQKVRLATPSCSKRAPTPIQIAGLGERQQHLRGTDGGHGAVRWPTSAVIIVDHNIGTRQQQYPRPHGLNHQNDWHPHKYRRHSRHTRGSLPQ